MAILQTIQCDICGARQTENTHGEGFVGWGAVHGFKLNDAVNPCLCPTCLTNLIPVVVKMREAHEQKETK